MYKKLLAKVTATAMVITMVATFGFTSFAAEETIEGNQTVQVAVSNEDEEKIVNGDVTVDEGTAVYATSGEVTVNGDVTGNVQAYCGGDITIKDDVTSNEDEYLLSPWGSRYGIGVVTASGEGTSVTVEGDVDASKLITERTDTSGTREMYSGNNGEAPSSVVEYDTTTVTGGADVGVYVEGGATVTVKGTITAGENGAVVKGNSTLNVGGDVVSNGKEITKSGTEYVNGEGASFTKKTVIENGKEQEKYIVDEGSTGKPAVWNEFISNGINTDGNGTIVVEDDVTGKKNGILIDSDSDGKAGSIVVLGTIKGEEYGIKIDDQYQMYKYYNELDVKYNEEGNKKVAEEMLKEMPQITVYAVEGAKAISDGKLGTRYVEGIGEIPYRVDCYEGFKNVYDSVVSAINYIIKQDDKSNADYSITVDKDTSKQEINGKEYFTTKINQAFAVAAKLPEGYTISGGDNVTVVDNGNGTFSLTLNNVKGGINLMAVLRPVSTGDNSSSGGNDYEVVVEEVTQTAPTPTQPGALVITSTSGQANAASNPEQAAIVAAISGDKPAQTISFSVGKVTPQQYKEAVINNVASVPANGALNLVTDKPSVIDYKMVEALSARSDIDVNVVFNYGGKRYKVVIPAGYDMKSLLDKNGYCGFLRLLAVLGGETI